MSVAALMSRWFLRPGTTPHLDLFGGIYSKLIEVS
jgi:hypothetical protein